MRKNFIPKFLFSLLILFCVPLFALAAPYVPLEPLPFLSQVRGTRLPDLLQALFQLLIIGGAGVAVLMITIGGIQYMTGEALHQKSEGRARIQNSVLGLILLLFIYLILRTINPQLLNFNLGSIEQVGVPSDRVVQQARATAAQINARAATPGPSPRFYATNAPDGSMSPSFVPDQGAGSATSNSTNPQTSVPTYSYTYDGGSGPVVFYTAGLSACQNATANIDAFGGSVTSGCAQTNF